MTRDPAVTSRIMSAVRNSGTRPEMLIRRALFSRGLRYRVRNRLPGRPDVVFPSAKVAVFVDGDWWHGNGWRLRGLPTFEAQFAHRNGAWWREKIETNMRRDRAADDALRTLGYEVVRLWESDVVSDTNACADRVTTLVHSRRQPEARPGTEGRP
jgi:DNA mismatch endonuclease, patch repair protein